MSSSNTIFALSPSLYLIGVILVKPEVFFHLYFGATFLKSSRDDSFVKRYSITYLIAFISSLVFTVLISLSIIGFPNPFIEESFVSVHFVSCSIERVSFYLKSIFVEESKVRSEHTS